MRQQLPQRWQAISPHCHLHPSHPVVAIYDCSLRDRKVVLFVKFCDFGIQILNVIDILGNNFDVSPRIVSLMLMVQALASIS